MRAAKKSKTKRAGGGPETKPAPAAAPTDSPPALEVPPILLEGDTPSTPPVSGPGRRYALGPEPATPGAEEMREAGELPEAYGTKRLYLLARDPHWIYAHWDFTREQLKQYNALSANRHLSLRVFKDAVADQPSAEIEVHPESRNWFVNVDHGSTKYVAELGYYSRVSKEWVAIATSTATQTPPDRPSDDVSAWFETLPPDLRFDHLVQLVKTAVAENFPLMETIQHLRASGFPGLPAGEAVAPETWTAARERALAELVNMDNVGSSWIGSLEIPELISRGVEQGLSSGAISSFGKGVETQKGFWLNVNAELIIYGATDPDAAVAIGGRAIQLRPDGTFSLRFALPDGEYFLPVSATSAEQGEQRKAELKFSRNTQYQGEVGKHPQDSALKLPSVENVA